MNYSQDTESKVFIHQFLKKKVLKDRVHPHFMSHICMRVTSESRNYFFCPACISNEIFRFLDDRLPSSLGLVSRPLKNPDWMFVTQKDLTRKQKKQRVSSFFRYVIIVLTEQPQQRCLLHPNSRRISDQHFDTHSYISSNPPPLFPL